MTQRQAAAIRAYHGLLVDNAFMREYINIHMKREVSVAEWGHVSFLDKLKKAVTPDYNRVTRQLRDTTVVLHYET